MPWSRLILQSGGFIDHLNVNASERLRVLLAAALYLALIVASFAAIAWWWAILLFLATAIANQRLTTLFFRRNGPLFAVGGFLFHQIYYLYSGAAFGWCPRKVKDVEVQRHPIPTKTADINEPPPTDAPRGFAPSRPTKTGPHFSPTRTRSRQ